MNHRKNPVSVHFFNTFIKFNLFQIEIFSGEDNILTMNQTHSKKFHCTYLLHYYPFDTQGNYSLQFTFLVFNKCIGLPLSDLQS